MMFRIAFALAGLLPCMAQQTLGSMSGVISGTVTGEDGTAVVGAYVTLHLAATHPQANHYPRTEWGTKSGTAGSFRFDGLGDGNYGLCAQVSGTAWLNPCEWRLPSPAVSLSTSERNPSVTMRLKKGVAVRIRIDDVGQLLSQHEGKTLGAHLLIGVTNGAGTFRTAILHSQDATGRNHQVVIPFDTPVNLVVSSSFFHLADVAGLPLPNTGIAIPVNVLPGLQPPTIRLSVTGGGR